MIVLTSLIWYGLDGTLHYVLGSRKVSISDRRSFTRGKKRWQRIELLSSRFRSPDETREVLPLQGSYRTVRKTMQLRVTNLNASNAYWKLTRGTNPGKEKYPTWFGGLGNKPMPFVPATRTPKLANVAHCRG